MQKAWDAKRVIVTADRDFGELAMVERQPHAGIVRLADLSLTEQSRALADVLAHYVDELLAGSILTVSPGRVRIRAPS